jgi:hypothetical protein
MKAWISLGDPEKSHEQLLAPLQPVGRQDEDTRKVFQHCCLFRSALHYVSVSEEAHRAKRSPPSRYAQTHESPVVRETHPPVQSQNTVGNHWDAWMLVKLISDEHYLLTSSISSTAFQYVASWSQGESVPLSSGMSMADILTSSTFFKFCSNADTEVPNSPAEMALRRARYHRQYGPTNALFEKIHSPY